MSFYLRRKIIKTRFFLMMCWIIPAVCVANPANQRNCDKLGTHKQPACQSVEQAKPAQPLIDGYYPAYPHTNPAEGELAKRIKRGEYLAKAGDCIACHTNVKENTPAFAGGLPIATPFGTFYSPNITPDKETGIGQWTEEDFVRAMKDGVDPAGRNYFPVFPFVYFANITDQDARDLYAYFMSIPPVHQVNKSLPFPFNVPGARMSLFGWKLLFFFPNTPFQEDKSQSSAWNRGKYLVDGLGHCSMCHTPLNALGSPINRFYLTGAFIDGYWAPNITQLGLEGVSERSITEVFSKNMLLNNAGPVAGPMAEVNHNSLSYLTDEDHMAIATYLKTVVSEQPVGIPGTDAAPTLKRGRQVYVSSCAMCHQNGEMSAPIIGNGSNWYMRLQDNGIKGLYQHAIKGYNSMPIKGACVTCSDNDIIAAVDYILNRSLSRSQRIDLTSGGETSYKPDGKNIYTENCAACHNEGKLGAPKIGDKDEWAPFMTENMDVIIEKVLKGRSHPIKGGCARCTNQEVIEAIKYIVSQSKSTGNYSLW